MSIRLKKSALIASAVVGAGAYLYAKKHGDKNSVQFTKTNADGTSGFDFQFDSDTFRKSASKAASAVTGFAADKVERIRTKFRKL